MRFIEPFAFLDLRPVVSVLIQRWFYFLPEAVGAFDFSCSIWTAFRIDMFDTLFLGLSILFCGVASPQHDVDKDWPLFVRGHDGVDNNIFIQVSVFCAFG